MAADTAGNNILAVGVPIGGFIALAPFGSTLPTETAGAASSLTLDAAFKMLGLLTTDGGPQFAWAPDGDPLQFWQDSYSIATGNAATTLTVKAAEALNDLVRQVVSGAAPTTNHFTTIDGGGVDTVWTGFTAEVFKNGAIRRRAIPSMQLQTATEDQNTRGSVDGIQLVFKINRSSVYSNKHFGEWVVPAS